MMSNAQLARGGAKDRVEARASLESGAKSGTLTLADLAAARAETEKLRRESQERSAEVAALRQSLQARDNTAVELRRALAESDGQMASLRQQSERMSSAHNAQLATSQNDHTEAKTISRVDVRRRPLEDSQRDLDTARTRSAALRGSRTGGCASGHRKTAARLGGAISLKPVEQELQSARKRIDALEREVNASRNAAAPLRTERDALRSQLMAVQSKLRDTESLVSTLQQSVRSDARRVAELQAVAHAASCIAVRGGCPPIHRPPHHLRLRLRLRLLLLQRRCCRMRRLRLKSRKCFLAHARHHGNPMHVQGWRERRPPLSCWQ